MSKMDRNTNMPPYVQKNARSRANMKAEVATPCRNSMQVIDAECYDLGPPMRQQIFPCLTFFDIYMLLLLVHIIHGAGLSLSTRAPPASPALVPSLCLWAEL